MKKLTIGLVLLGHLISSQLPRQTKEHSPKIKLYELF